MGKKDDKSGKGKQVSPKKKEDSQKNKGKEGSEGKKVKDASLEKKGKSGKTKKDAHLPTAYSKLPLLEEVLPKLATLSEAELGFFENVKSSNFDKVAKMLSSEDFKETMNINTFNIMGFTVLHVAVRNQDERMVKLLLEQEGINIYDTVLHAIYEGNEVITKLLLVAADAADAKVTKVASPSSTSSHLYKPRSSLKARRSDHETQNRTGIITTLRPVRTQEEEEKKAKMEKETTKPEDEKEDENEENNSKSDSPKAPAKEIFLLDSEFHPVITPLMLAAQQGSTPLMQLFYTDRNERLESEQYHHNVECPCDICQKLEGKADMNRAYQRLHLFKAITNPEYICFIATEKKMDPVQYAIDKIVRIRAILEREQCFDKLYADMPDELEKFICDYLSQCEDTEETELLMSMSKSATDYKRSRFIRHRRYPRLYDSVGFELKKFVAHPYSQNLVSKMWTADEWAEWESSSYVTCFMHLLGRVAGFILLAPIHFLGSKFCGKRAWGAPASRFLNHIAAYIYFLAALSWHIKERYSGCSHQHEIHGDTRECDRRGPPDMGLSFLGVVTWYMVLAVLGTLVSIGFRMKIGWFLRRKWNLVEIACQLLMAATLISWMYSKVWVLINPELEYALEREMWPHYSAEVIGECLLAVGTMLAFARFLRFTQLLPEIGPLQVGVGKQIVGTFSFMGVYLIFMFAFGSGLMGIYAPYRGFHGYDDKNAPKKQDNTFAKMVPLFHHLIYAVRGGHNAKPATLLKWEINLTDGSGEGDDVVTHDLNQFTGLALLTILNIIASMMLGSILGGYLGATRNEVTKDADTTWKFSKTELYLTFMEDTLMPPPYNLFEWIFGCKGVEEKMKMDEEKGSNDTEAGDGTDPNDKSKMGGTGREKMLDNEFNALEKNYMGLTTKLSQRYRKFRSDAEKKEAASRDDVLEIGEELGELKSELKKKRNHPTEMPKIESYPMLPTLSALQAEKGPETYPEFGPPRSSSLPGIPILTSDESEACELPPASPQALLTPSRPLKSPTQAKATSPQSPSTPQKGQGSLPPKTPTRTLPKAEQVLITPSGRVIPKLVSSPDGGAQASPSSRKGTPPPPSQPHPSTISSPTAPPTPPPLAIKRKSWDKAKELLKTKSGRERGKYGSSPPPSENREDATRVAPIVMPRPLILSDLSEADDETSPPQSTSPGSPNAGRQVFGTPSPKKEGHK